MTTGLDALVLDVHATATLVMLGVILVIQLVHYPLFAGVGREGFVAYERDHTRRITWIVLPAMTVELVTAGWLAWSPPAGIAPAAAWVGAALVAVIWGSTSLIQVPLHEQLGRGFDSDAHRRLVTSNWIRTIAWVLRAALVLIWLR